MDFVCIDRLEGDGLTARTVAVRHDSRFEDNVAYALKGTPCGAVVDKGVCCFPDSVCQLFLSSRALLLTGRPGMVLGNLIDSGVVPACASFCGSGMLATVDKFSQARAVTFLFSTGKTYESAPG